MPIEVTCPSCAKTLRLADEHAGKAGRCPACQTVFQIPAGGAPPSPMSGFGAPLNPAPQSPTPQQGFGGDLFAGMGPANPNPQGANPNPYGSQNPFGSSAGNVNPYQSPQAPQPASYQSSLPPSDPREGYAVASMVLGIASIVAGLFSVCCCLGWFVSIPCGVIGLVLTFQGPLEKRNIGMILNISGLALNVLVIIGQIVLQIVLMNANRPGAFPVNP